MPLTDAELDELSVDLAFARTDVCSTLRAPTVNSGIGTPSNSDYAANLTNIDCRIEVVSSARPLPGVPFGTDATHAVLVQRGRDVIQTDRVTVRGMVLEVLGIAKPTYYAELLLACRRLL
jgi:hypothetical protein